MSARTRLVVPGLAGIAMLAGGLAGPAPAVAQGDDSTHVDVSLGYDCAGAHPVELRVVADIPASGTVPEPVQPTGVALTMTVPPLAVDGLTAAGATSVTAVARLGVTITHRDAATGEDSSAAATWSAVRNEPAGASGAEDLVLELDPADGVSPAGAAAGELVFAAATLTATVTGYLPDGAVTDPPTVELDCVLAPEQDATLATVTLSEVDTPAPDAEPPPGTITVDPPAGGAPPSALAEREVPEDCEIIDPPPGPPTNPRYCAYVTGYANVAKLDTSVLQPPGLVNIGPTGFERPCDGDPRLNCQKANILPNLAGEPVLPAAKAAALAFAFVPTVARMQLTQIGLSTADVRVHGVVPPTKSGATITARYTARLFDAEADGVPLDLGPRCRTAEPIEIVLTTKEIGVGEGKYTLTGGGPLSGIATIPAFAGCGATEDLDPLISGLISGPGNVIKLVQGPICTITGSNNGCPPVIPEPQR